MSTDFDVLILGAGIHSAVAARDTDHIGPFLQNANEHLRSRGTKQ